MKRQLFLLAFVIVFSCVTPRPQKNDLAQWVYSIFDRPKSISPPDNCPPCQCGITRTRRRIVQGKETKVLEYPWMVELRYGGQYYCGGSLLNDLYVLTAAHCTVGFRKEKMLARFLEHDQLNASETKTIDRKIKAVIRHPQFGFSTYDNDIALLKLDKRVDLSNALKRIRRKSSIDEFGESKSTPKLASSEAEDLVNEEEDEGLRPICLPPPGLLHVLQKGVVTGWGTTSEGGKLSNVLREVNVTIISNQNCRRTVYLNRITDNMLCAGEPQGKYDACQGDSGGPLHVLDSSTHQFQQVGIVSWGEGCAAPATPGVYVRVNRYLNWIENNTRDACTCH